jgi:pimeloyl-ACP methyl ester carboxylesterase
MRRITKIVGIALAAGMVAGIIYEQVGARQDRERPPAIGQLVDVGGYRLNLYCSGEGSPTVVFDAGAGAAGYSWSEIHAAVAGRTRACWFDRAGMGWSDTGPYPRTAAQMSRELHTLLQRARVPGPYVLVGHSLGGLNARIYAGLYLGEVAGAVLVDAAHEDEPRRAPKFMLGRDLPRMLWHPLWLTAQAFRLVGVLRLTRPAVRVPGDQQGWTRNQILRALRQQPKTIATLIGDATTPESYAEAEASPGFGDGPLIVLTRGKIPASEHPGEIDRQSAAYEQVWMHEIQPKLARLSTRGRQTIVEKSGHGIPQEAPETVVNAVTEVVDTIRRDTHSAPAESGGQ